MYNPGDPYYNGIYNNMIAPRPAYQGVGGGYAPQMQVVRVNGRNGAEVFAMGANSSALLLDESGLLVWLVTTDGAGYKTVAAYDITPHKDAPSVDVNALEARIKRLEEAFNGNSGNSSAAGAGADGSSTAAQAGV